MARYFSPHYGRVQLSTWPRNILGSNDLTEKILTSRTIMYGTIQYRTILEVIIVDTSVYRKKYILEKIPKIKRTKIETKNHSARYVLHDGFTPKKNHYL